MRDLGTSAAARALGVSAQTVRNMAQDGRLAHYRLPTGFRRFRKADVLAAREGRGMAERPREAPSYHDLFITTHTIARTSIFNLPFGLTVTCDRVGGWELWDHNRKAPAIRNRKAPATRGSSLDPGPLLIAGEYDSIEKGLRLDVAGHVICDSLTRPKDT